MPDMSWGADSERLTKSVVIANGASLSEAVNLQDYRISAIDMPAAWTTAALTFQGSPTNVTYQNLYDDAGAEVTIPAGASTAAQNVCLGAAFALHLMSHNWIKVRSGTAGTPVNQAAARTIILVLVPAI